MEKGFTNDHSSRRYVVPIISNRASPESVTSATILCSEDGTFILELHSKSDSDTSDGNSSTNTIHLTESILPLTDVEEMVHEGFLMPLILSREDKSSLAVKRFAAYLPKFIRHLTEAAFFLTTNLCNTQPTEPIETDALHETGIEALNLLRLLSSRSMKYVDDCKEPILLDEIIVAPSQESLVNKNNFYDHGIAKTTINTARVRNLIYPVDDLLDVNITDAIQKHLHKIKQGGMLSTNLDSVDSLPSLHLNLISNGRPLFHQHPSETQARDEKELVFKQNIVSMVSLLRPFLYEKLLSLARKVLKSPTLQISDVFIRSYGVNVQQPSVNNTDEVESRGPSLQDENSRLKLSAHYDVQSAATCVIALDNVAAEGNRGLYTMSQHSMLRNKSLHMDSDGQVSSHFALRRFFPLSAGDGLIHSWDILHGVHIDDSVQRSSLIVWFTEEENNVSSSCYGTEPWPWLRHLDETDDVGKIVLALAKESTLSTDKNLGSWESINLPLPTSMENNISSIGSPPNGHPHILFKQSASLGNSFALARLGSLCEEGKLSPNQCTRSELYSLLQKLRFDRTMTSIVPYNPFIPKQIDLDDNLSWSDLAKACWFESAMRGNKMAQISLADACMQDYYSTRDSSLPNICSSSRKYSLLNKREFFLRMASTLFVLAFQQDGYMDVKSSLTRLAKVEFSRFSDDYNLDDESFDQELFFSRPVMKILLCCTLD